VIKLHSFPGRWGLESLSPFAMKVEVYLKARKLPYETSYGNPRGAPKQKVPWVADADGTIIADSSAILAHFEKKSKTPFDEGMDENARARAHAIKAADRGEPSTSSRSTRRCRRTPAGRR